MRLDKYLSLQGYTRKQAKALAAAGRVRLGDAPARDASVHVPPDAEVFLDGKPLAPQLHRHLMLHKPRGVITATQDAHGKPTVLDLVPGTLRRKELGPVGRLDKDVSGLILLTTDGQLAHRLISPKWLVEKRYLARVDGELNQTHVRRMQEGIALTDFVAKPAALTILESGATSLAELSVTEGKYHQVKRMFGAMATPVIELTRLSIGGIGLDPALSPGECRALTRDETERLYALVALDVPR